MGGHPTFAHMEEAMSEDTEEELDDLYEEVLEVARAFWSQSSMVNQRDRTERRGVNARLRLRVRKRYHNGRPRLVIEWTQRVYHRKKSDGSWFFRTKSVPKGRNTYLYPIGQLRKLAGDKRADMVEEIERYFAQCREHSALIGEKRRILERLESSDQKRQELRPDIQQHR